MGTYVTDGENEIGVALTDSWAAVWTVDTPNIEVIRRDFWDEHADEIKAAAERGRNFSDDDGQTGCVAVIGTNGDLDANRAYVAAMLDLQVWAHHLYHATTARAHEHEHAA